MNSVVLGSLHCIEFITTEKSVCIISFKICESNPDPVESKKKKQKKQEHNEKKKATEPTTDRKHQDCSKNA